MMQLVRLADMRQEFSGALEDIWALEPDSSPLTLC